MTRIETAIKMTLDRWYGSVASLDKLLSVLSDEQLQKETKTNPQNYPPKILRAGQSFDRSCTW